ncbi:ABC transporter permease [bacterium]|nr:ABC transporter permease [bacterium]
MRFQLRTNSPPLMAAWMVRRFFPGKGYASSEGDFAEVYDEMASQGPRFLADCWYWTQLYLSLQLCVLEFLKWEFSMIRNYIKTALRNIRNQKFYTIINVTGLAMSICVCLFLFLFIDYELGFDSHIEKADLIYRVVREADQPAGRVYDSSTQFPMSKALRNDFPDLPSVTQTYRFSSRPVWINQQRFELEIAMFVEPAFFDLMQPEWIIEDMDKGVAPNSVILTEVLALQYYGSTDVLGRRLTLGDSLELTVTGVLANPPEQSSLPYKMLVSWGAMEEYYDNDGFQRWSMVDGASQTFLRLPQQVSRADFESQLDQFKLKYLELNDQETDFYFLQSIKDMHFDAKYGAYPYITSRSTLWVFATTGFLILVIACINFINLTTARAMRRAKEMGMRKVLGANRQELVRQLMGETSVLILMAMTLGIVGVSILLPYAMSQLGMSLAMGRVFSLEALCFFAGLFGLLLLINGVYPAMVLSRYQPVEALKKGGNHKGSRSATLRNALVLIQFAVTQVLIVATLVIASQVKFIGDKDLGFRKQGIITVDCPSYTETQNEALRSRWMQNPHVENVSFAWRPPSSGSNFNTTFEYVKRGDDTEYPITIKMSDTHYLDVYDIPLLAGSFFARNCGDDSLPKWVINEATLRIMGLMHPQEAIGEVVNINGMDGPVIGVIKDFHAYSLKDRIEPVVMFNFWASNHHRAQIRVDEKELPETLAFIRTTWEATFPDEPFSYDFLDAQLARRYKADARVLKLIQIASILAICIGCLGLLGLVSFVLAQRTKEIGIRKVLGASVDNLYYLIAKGFIKWILAANIISWPIAYLLSRQWLQGFAYRIPLSIHLFLLGSAMILGIALLVVSFQVIKASRSNPIKALKYE